MFTTQSWVQMLGLKYVTKRNTPRLVQKQCFGQLDLHEDRLAIFCIVYIPLC